MTGFHDGVRQQILGNVPHVLIQRHGQDMEGYLEVARKAKAASPDIVVARPFVTKEAMLLSKNNVAAVNVKGIEAGNKVFDQDFISIDSRPVEELLFQVENGFPGLVIGIDTAASLGVAVGDVINVIPPLFTISPFGMMPKMKPFRIVGIFRQRGGFLDTYFGFVSLSEAQKFFDTEGRVSGIEIEADSFDNSQAVASLLREEFGYPYVVRSWEDLFGSFLSALKLEKLGLFIVLGIIVLVAAFNIATTLIMVVMEKHKDIAILRAMGATSSSIMKIFVLEGFIIGTLGTSLGTGLGLLLAKNADPIIKWIESVLHVRIFILRMWSMSWPSP